MAITLKTLIFGSEEELRIFAEAGLESVKTTLPTIQGRPNSKEVVARIEAVEKLFNDSKYLEAAIDMTLIWIMAGGASEEEVVNCKNESFQIGDGLTCLVQVDFGSIDAERLKLAIVYKIVNSYMWSLINREISLSVSPSSFYATYPEKAIKFANELVSILTEHNK